VQITVTVERGVAGEGLLCEQALGGGETTGSGHGRGDGPHVGLRGSAGVQPGGDLGRNGVNAVGFHRQLADGGHTTALLRCGPGGANDRGQCQHRVVPIDEPGGAGVVGLTEQVEAPPAVRSDGGADGHRAVEVDEPAALLDVQLDEHTDPAQGFLGGNAAVPDELGLEP